MITYAGVAMMNRKWFSCVGIRHVNAVGLVRAALLVVVALTLAPHADAVVVYTHRNAWEAAVGGGVVITDTFSNPIPFSKSITFDSGIVSTGKGVDSVLPDSNVVDAGSYSGRVDTFNRLANTFDSLTWTFPMPIFALGADWFGALTGGDLTLTGNFDGIVNETLNFDGRAGFSGTGFLGIVGSALFDTVTLGTQTRIRDEAFRVDNLSFAVPAPASWGLLAIGFAGLAFARRNRRSSR